MLTKSREKINYMIILIVKALFDKVFDKIEHSFMMLRMEKNFFNLGINI
jgi:hypothetical protein